MRILVATHALASFGGTESYVEAVAVQLGRMGHEVMVWAPTQGRVAEALRERGLRVAATEDELGGEPDRILANTADVAYDLAARWPDVAQAYVCHSEVFELQMPPQLPGVVAALIVMHDRVGRWASALGHRPEIVRLRQPVDLARFAPRGAPRERAAQALVLGNYARGARRAVVERACRQAGIEPLLIGSLGGATERPEEAIGKADIVIGKARVIVEAMAGGRPAYVYDHNGGDGWVTPSSYEALEADNFGGQATDAPIDAGRLADDLAAYEPAMGLANRDLAVRRHSVIQHAEGLAALLERIGPPPRATLSGAPLRELARLTRSVWAAESALLGARLEAERAHDRVVELESAVAGLEASAASAARDRAEVAALLERALAAERALGELKATRRYRLARALAMPLDRLRARAR